MEYKLVKRDKKWLQQPEVSSSSSMILCVLDRLVFVLLIGKKGSSESVSDDEVEDEEDSVPFSGSL
jgi:hypothetical protein